MSKALGGVGRNAVKEIGWGEIQVADNPQARTWFGSDLTRFESFHWHGETFTIPPGAVRIMGNRIARIRASSSAGIWVCNVMSR